MARLNVVFDFGAVLFAWEPGRLIQQLFPAHAATDAQATALAGEVFGHADWRAFDGGLSEQGDTAQRIHQRTALPLPALSEMIDNIGRKLQPIATSVAALDELRVRRDAGEDIGLYFLSNMPAPYARELEQRHAFLQWFDGGIFSADVKLTKPDRQIYALADQRFDLAAGSTVFIDDMAVNIAAAQAHGWRGVHLPQPHALRALLWDEIGF